MESPKWMRSPGINGGELRGQLANPGSPGKMAIKMECVCMCVYVPIAKTNRFMQDGPAYNQKSKMTCHCIAHASRRQLSDGSVLSN